jgi:hypothetical protein
MPFHVEISSPLDRTRAFNVEEADLRTAVLEPWVIGLPFEFGHSRWQPRESRLTILESPALPATDPNLEKRWTDALQAAEDVTRPLLEAAEASAPAQTAVVVEAVSFEAALKELQAGRPPQQIPWASAVERIEARDADVAAVILVVRKPGPAWPRLESGQPPPG